MKEEEIVRQIQAFVACHPSLYLPEADWYLLMEVIESCPECVSYGAVRCFETIKKSWSLKNHFEVEVGRRQGRQYLVRPLSRRAQHAPVLYAGKQLEAVVGLLACQKIGILSTLGNAGSILRKQDGTVYTALLEVRERSTRIVSGKQWDGSYSLLVKEDAPLWVWRGRGGVEGKVTTLDEEWRLSFQGFSDAYRQEYEGCSSTRLARLDLEIATLWEQLREKSRERRELLGIEG